jgi:hypothetical protein
VAAKRVKLRWKVLHVFDVLRKGSLGRWAVVLAATAAFMVGGGFPGSVGSAQAGNGPGNVGSPGQDGQDVTCSTYNNVTLVHGNVLCNGVGGDGKDGAPGADRR